MSLSDSYVHVTCLECTQAHPVKVGGVIQLVTSEDFTCYPRDVGE